MPVSRTRVCPLCDFEKATPSAFRDPGETGAGRPPKVCHECRTKHVDLQLHQQANVTRRFENREYRRSLAARSSLSVLLDRWAAHPDDRKTCPPIGGCGRRLHVSNFHTNAHQKDGLAPICRRCAADARTLRDS
ncbi:hypothetical protein J2Y69_003379 [Microbacterium resistens]|uniref:HNH endonuclease n=1 Tax=Microbacterium resistens TaxID=156977 RepID=A0ABU1SGN0_9MICO|nr:hypothetical protein [Microbacterium resistens]MDR6868755.1 hypothetical protein [Microbacterium resistens]